MCFSKQIKTNILKQKLLPKSSNVEDQLHVPKDFCQNLSLGRSRWRFLASLWKGIHAVGKKKAYPSLPQENNTWEAAQQLETFLWKVKN